MPPETSPPRRRWHVGWWLLTLGLAVCVWVGWREYDYRAAVREARAAGYEWSTDEPLTLYRNAWEKWVDPYGRLHLGLGADLTRVRSLLPRLRAKRLIANYCLDTGVDALKGLNGLQELHIYDYPGLQNADALEGLSTLTELELSGCPELRNVDGLKGLTRLRNLRLSHNPGLQNVNGIKGLAELQVIDIYECPSLQDVKVFQGLSNLFNVRLSHCPGVHSVSSFKKLTGLNYLDLTGSTGIPGAELRELRAALPKTDITFPDGSKAPPP